MTHKKDEFTCPAGLHMTDQTTSKHHTENGYLTERRFYQSAHCEICPLKLQCTKAQGNRRIQVSLKLREYHQQAKNNLLSKEGIALRKQRSTHVETSFANIKHNMGFRRFMLRSLKKVEIEWGLLAIAHNMQKLAVQ